MSAEDLPGKDEPDTTEEASQPSRVDEAGSGTAARGADGDLAGDTAGTLAPKRSAPDVGTGTAGLGVPRDAAQVPKGAVGEKNDRSGSSKHAGFSGPGMSSGIDDAAGMDAGIDGGKPRVTARERAREGAAKGAGIAGKRVGAQDAGQFLRKGTDSDGSVKGDVKAVTSGATDGAKVGAAFGGVGAPVGAVVGGALQAAKTKTGRRLVMLNLLAMFAVPLMLVITLVIVFVPAIFGGSEQERRMPGTEAALADGVPLATQAVYAEADRLGVAWEVMAAIVDVAQEGNHPDPDEGGHLSEDEAEDAESKNSDVGPYRILAGDAVEVADRRGIRLDVRRLPDLEASTFFLAAVLESYLLAVADSRPVRDVDSFDLTTGVVRAEPPGSARMEAESALFILGDDPSGNGWGLGQEDTAHEALREVYIEAIGMLPISGAEVNAERIFDIAMAWHLGRSSACTPGFMNAAGSGGWANPAVGPITSRYGYRIHPVFGVGKLHDGTDIGAAMGDPVYAASGGVVTVSSKTWSGANHVTIDHGGGLTTEYAHMRAATVTTGQMVQPGQQVGEIGSEGFSTGPHLHFMVVEAGSPIDPEPFMSARGVTLGSAGSGGTGTGVVTASLQQTEGSGAWQGTSDDGQTVTLDSQQLAFAATVARTGSSMGVGDNGIVIAFMTAFVESAGINAATAGQAFNNYASTVYPETQGQEYPRGAVGSDFDSVGIFQQRPQSGWGEPLQLMDVAYAAAAFFGGPNGPNNGSPKGLLDHPGWESRPKGEMAQTVQVSAHPDRYAPWEQASWSLLATVRNMTGIPTADCVGAGYTFTAGYTVGSLNASTLDGDTPEERAGAVMSALEGRGVAVATVQATDSEMQAAFDDHSGSWGYRAGDTAMVVWRSTEWQPVRSEGVTVPSGGSDARQPLVLLERTTTGERVWVLSADHTGGPATRRAALDIELGAAQSKESDGHPVFVSGSFDDADDEQDRAQCVLAPVMSNAFGDSPRGCQPPEGDAPDDHIYSLGVTLTGASADAEARIVTAVVPAQGPGGCAPHPDNPIAANSVYTSNAVAISNCLYGSYRDHFTTIGGYRSSSTSGNHETGCALDIMIRDWETSAGQAYGDEISQWLMANAEQMGVQYLIWRQAIWAPSRVQEGWRPMSDRGSATANHYDHVHVSVHGPRCVDEVR